VADIARPAETVLVVEALSFEYGMTCRLRMPAPKDAVDASSPYYGLNYAPRLLGAILLFCMGSIAYDYYTRIHLPNRLQPDPEYDDAPPEQARSPWR